MRRNVSLCLVLMLVLCTLGSVAVFAEDVPVITGGYMGGIPGVGQYLHVVVDGTYQGNSFENALTSAGAYAVTADYSWEYGEGGSWTAAAPVDAGKRLCKVTADMVGKYVRCTVTPKAGDVTGASYTVQFPGKMVSSVTWTDAVRYHVTFDDASEASFLKDLGAGCLNYDADKKAMKLSEFPITEKDGKQQIISSKVGWVFNAPITVRTDSQILIRFDLSTDQGKITKLQAGLEGSGINFSDRLAMHDPVRGGIYIYPSADTTLAQKEMTLNPYEVVTSAWKSKFGSDNINAVMTSAMLSEYGQTSNIWLHPHMSGGNGAYVENNASALYTDNIVVIEKTVSYTVTYTSNGQTVKTEKVPSGTRTLSLPASEGKKIASLTVNGTDQLGRVSSGTVTLQHPVYEDLTVDFTEDDVAISRISLAKNKTQYIGEDRAAEGMNIVGYDGAGASYDISAWAGVSVTSSDESVFTVSDGKVASTGKNGMAVITASFENVSGSVVMIRQPKTLNGTYSAKGTTYAVQTDADISSSRIDATTPGHYDNDSFTFPSGQVTCNNYGLLDLRMYQGGYKSGTFKNHGFSSTGVWFYEDGSSPVDVYFEMLSQRESDADIFQELGYGQFADYWSKHNGVTCCFRLKAALNATEYSINNKTKSLPRVVGWHQVVYSLEKNPNAVGGWTCYAYLDGEPVGSLDVTGKAVGDTPHMELRIVSQDKVVYSEDKENSKKTVEFYPTHVDDFFMAGSLAADIHGVQLTGAENGTVSVNGAALENGAWTYVTEGESAELTLTPAEGYQVKSVTLGDQALVINQNKITLENVTADSVLNVAFEEIPSINPGIESGVTSITTSDYSGKPAAVVYSKLTAFNTGAVNQGYGIKLWKTSDPDHVLTLPAMSTKTDPAVAAPGQAFAIRVFGEAIKSGESYTAQPYVGDESGEQKDISFE